MSRGLKALMGKFGSTREQMCNFSREIEIRCKMDVEKNLRPFVDLMKLKKESATLKIKQMKLYKLELREKEEGGEEAEEGREKEGVKRGKRQQINKCDMI